MFSTAGAPVPILRGESRALVVRFVLYVIFEFPAPRWLKSSSFTFRFFTAGINFLWNVFKQREFKLLFDFDFFLLILHIIGHLGADSQVGGITESKT